MCDKKIIVLDSGSYEIKAGFAGDDKPESEIPPVVGRLKHQGGWGRRRKLYVGDEAQSRRGILEMSLPNELGIIHKWDDMVTIWNYTLEKQLRVTPCDHPILLTESPFMNDTNRKKMAEVMFETFCVPHMYTAMDAAMALYHSGKTDGLVLSSGAYKTYALPFRNGRLQVRREPSTINSSDVGGTQITTYLTNALHFTTSAEKELANDIKETLCYVASNFDQELKTQVSLLEKPYEFPDGQVVTVKQERIRGPELLFQPEQYNGYQAGVHEVTHKAIMMCSPQLRKDMFANIVLAGGNTMFPGIAERLKKEVAALAPAGTNISITAPEDRDLSAWLGASKFASQPDFIQKCISKKEFEEHGSDIFLKKCLM